MIRVTYSCPECHVRNVPVMVPERTEFQNAREWVCDIMFILYLNHLLNYPSCVATLEITAPVDESKGIEEGLGKRAKEH